MRSIKQDEFGDVVAYAIKRNSVLFAVGKPGIGKSAIVHQKCKELGRRVVDIRASLYDVGDLITRVATEDRTSLVEVVSEVLPREKGCVLLLDEFMQSNNEVRRMFYQLILDRALGSKYKLPEDTAIIVLSNHTTDVEAEELENPLYDRMILRVDVEGDFNVWKQYAYKKGIKDEVLAYLEIMKEHFLYYGADEKLEMSPRRWEMVSDNWDMRKYVMSDNISPMFEEFIQSVLEYKDLEKYLDGSKKMSTDLDVQYKIATAVLMSGDKKLYTYVIENDLPFKAEVDVFLIMSSIRKLTGEIDLVKAFSKLEKKTANALIGKRIPKYEWMFR